MSYTGMPVGAYSQPMQPWGNQLDQHSIAMEPQPLQDFSGQYYYTRPQGTTQHQTAHQGQFGSAILSQGQPSPMNSTVSGHGVAHSHYASSGSSQASWASQFPANARAASQQWAMPPPTNAQVVSGQWAMPPPTNAQVVSGQWAMSPSTNLQAAPPQQTIHQGGFLQPGLPPPTLQQAGPPQTAFPQAGFQHFQQEASTGVTVPQAIPPQNISQQPYYSVEAPQPPQESSLSFDERLAAFRPVPEPHPEPVARPGPGRKKKLQRFWAPQGASEDLKRRYGRLQTVDQRVTIAERKLAKNKDKPSCIPHLQNILIRNMQEREDLWTQCQRVEQGLVAIELPLPEAEAQAKKMHKAWKDERDRYRAKWQSLKAGNQQAIDDNGNFDTRRLGIKDRQGLQTMCNWVENRWSLLCDSLDTLTHAFNLMNEFSPEASKAFLTRIHKLGIYEGWSKQFQHMIDERRRFSDPDPATWGLEYEEPITPAQPEMQNHQYGQLENAQPADDLQFNHDFGNGLDQAASVNGGFVEHGSFSQPQQAPNYEPNQQGLQFQQDLNYDWNQQGWSQFQQPPPHDGNHQEVELQQAPNYDGNQDELQEITEEDALAEIQGYEQQQLQPEQLQQSADESRQIIAEMERQELVMSDAQVAEIFGTTGPNGEYQPPPGQEPPNNEARHNGNHQQPEVEQAPNYNENQDELQEITLEDAEAEIQAYEQGQLQQEQPQQEQPQQQQLHQAADDLCQKIYEQQPQESVFTDAQVGELFGTTGPDGEYQPPPRQETPNDEGMGSSSGPGDADAPHEIDPDYQENQDVEMEDAFSFDSYLVMDEHDELEKTGDDEWLEDLFGGEME